MRNETIVCISIPDESLREKSTKGLELKKSALLVDTKFDEVKGFYDDDMYELLEETCTELENTDPDKPLNVSCKYIYIYCFFFKRTPLILT